MINNYKSKKLKTIFGTGIFFVLTAVLLYLFLEKRMYEENGWSNFVSKEKGTQELAAAISYPVSMVNYYFQDKGGKVSALFSCNANKVKVDIFGENILEFNDPNSNTINIFFDDDILNVTYEESYAFNFISVSDFDKEKFIELASNHKFLILKPSNSSKIRPIKFSLHNSAQSISKACNSNLK